MILKLHSYILADIKGIDPETAKSLMQKKFDEFLLSKEFSGFQVSLGPRNQGNPYIDAIHINEEQVFEYMRTGKLE